jgi:quinoprotein glucose dehydrogenase
VKSTRVLGRATMVSLVALVFLGAPATAQYGAADGEWRSYAGDVGGTKYSQLEQIDATNFSRLQQAWSWTTVDATLSTDASGGEWTGNSVDVFNALQDQTPDLWRSDAHPRIDNLKATPLMVGDRLFLNTPLSIGVSLDARTGELLWAYNPKSYEDGTTSMTVIWNQRGVAYWTDGASDERVFWGTGNGYLVCVDAMTGRPCADFGENGRVDLQESVPRAPRGDRDYLNALLYSVQSPPLVLRDVVVTPVSIADRRITKEAVPGWIRGWDVRTGEERWSFHTVPQEGELGVDTWENESWRYSGNTNVWSTYAGDEEFGLLYAPTGTATNDFYGVDRLGSNLFSESLIAINVETGLREWHFQAVHHGLWDYDFPVHPNLIDLNVDGREIKAIAQISKQGFTYVFDRLTGEPVWPIEERRVDTDTNVPGEVLWPTQPFPTKPAPFEYQGVSIDDLINFTPELREMAVEAIQPFRWGPLFEPISLHEDGGTQGTILRPGTGGGASWTGAAVDPETGVLYVPSVSSFQMIHLYDPREIYGDQATVAYTHGGPGSAPRMPNGLPLFKPPYSRITAIDLNTGDHLWMQPNGNGDDIRHHDALRDLDLPPLGDRGVRITGPLLTRTLLVTGMGTGGTDDGPQLVARDKMTGEVVGAIDLPALLLGTPMTYMLDGEQYISLTVSDSPPRLLAFKLP